jgi:hypothetical protein
MYSVRHVQQDQDQAFLLRCHLFSLTCLTSLTLKNRHLPGTLRIPVQITFVTTMLDAGVDLRDVQIAARHADPRTTMRYDRARQNLDRHPNYILAAYMASGT